MPSLSKLGNGPKITISENVLGSSIIITAIGNDGFENVGIVLTLPSAGTYNIRYNLGIQISTDGTFDNTWIKGRLYDIGADSVIPGSLKYLHSLEQVVATGDLFPRQAEIDVFYTTTEATTVDLQIDWHNLSTNTGAIAANDTSYGYVKFS